MWRMIKRLYARFLAWLNADPPDESDESEEDIQSRAW